MKGDAEVISALNELLTHELTAINQYYVHSKMCGNWGYKALAKKKMDEAMEEMRHADALIERILLLEGVPNMQRLGAVKVGEDAIEVHKLDLVLEEVAVERLNRVIELFPLGDRGLPLRFRRTQHAIGHRVASTLGAASSGQRRDHVAL